MTKILINREQIVNALGGKLVAGTNEKGFVYQKAGKQECNDFILEAYDHAVTHVAEQLAWVKLYDEFIKRKLGIDDVGLVRMLCEEYGGIAGYSDRKERIKYKLLYSKEE